MRKLILFIVLLLSAHVANADTYPASVSVGVFPSTCGSDFSSGIECYRRFKCVEAGYNPDTIASTIPLYTSYCPRPAYDLTQDSGYYHVTWNWGATSNLAYRSENFLKTYSCPHGGTLSGISCINVSPCTAPAVRDSTGECKLPVLNCSSTEYDLSGVCTPIPDCNSGILTGGNFFDKIDKVCKSGDLTICISEINTKYCPPIQDCKPDGYICSNDTAVVDAANATRESEIALSKAKADAKKSEIVTIKLQSEAAAASKLAASEAAKASKDSAKLASDAALASGVPEAIASAIENYNKFAQDYIDSLSRSVNSDQALAKIKAIDDQASVPVAAIPTSNPGNADALNKSIDPLLNDAITALSDAVSGDGNGDGPGSGVPTSTSPSVDTSKLGKDSTLKEISDKLTGGAPGVFTDGPESFYDSAYPDGISGVWDNHKAALSQTSFVSAITGLVPSIGSAGVCPSWSIPVWGGGTAELQPPCMIWPLLRVIFLITSLFTARSLIFGG